MFYFFLKWRHSQACSRVGACARPSLSAFATMKEVGIIFSIKENYSLSEYCSLVSNRMTNRQLVEPDTYPCGVMNFFPCQGRLWLGAWTNILKNQ